MKSLFCSATLLVAAAASLPAQNTPPAPVPHGTGATAGSAPPAAAPAVDPAGLVDPATPEELKQYGLDRYDKIVEKSPFNFKIVNAAPPPTISFAADLSLAGITTDLGKGIKYATIVDKKKNTRFVINTLSPNKDGIQLVKADRRDTLLSSTVLARKGGEEAEIKAEKQIVERKAVVAASAGGQPRGGPNQPGVQPGVQPGIQPGLPPGGGGPQGGPQGGPGRSNDVQARINQQLQPPTPGAAPAQPGAANATGGGVQPTAAAQPTPAAPTVADQALQRQNPATAAQPNGAPPPQQNKRRVILPPPITTQ